MEWLCELCTATHWTAMTLMFPEHMSGRCLFISEQTRLWSMYAPTDDRSQEYHSPSPQVMFRIIPELCQKMLSLMKSTDCLAQEGERPSSVAAISCQAGFHFKMPKVSYFWWFEHLVQLSRTQRINACSSPLLRRADVFKSVCIWFGLFS